MDRKTNIKYSIVFLEYDPDGLNRDTSHKALTSIIGNSKGYNFELIHVKNVKGFVHAVNEGLTRSSGDYIITVANDVFIEDPKWLEKFTVDGLGGWRLTPFFITQQPRPDFACWGVSREASDKIGLMDERFAEGYGFDDDDLTFRAREAGINIYDAQVKLNHLENLTYSTCFTVSQKETMTGTNEYLFRTKWKDKLEEIKNAQN